MNDWPVWSVLPSLLAVAGCSLWWLGTRVTGDVRLRRLVLVAYGIRVVLAIILFLVSSLHWPLLRSFQLPEGFWSFTGDAATYHRYGELIADWWRHGTPLPSSIRGASLDYSLLVAALYWLLGVHPLYPAALNAWITSLCGLLAYVITRRLADSGAALRSALLVCFWPSTIIWSVEAMKDPLCWLLLLSALYLMVRLLGHLKPDGQPLVSATVYHPLCWMALAGVLIILTRVREFAGYLFAWAATVMLLPWGFFKLLQAQWSRAASAALVAGLTVSSAMLAHALIDRQRTAIDAPSSHVKIVAETAQHSIVNTQAVIVAPTPTAPSSPTAVETSQGRSLAPTPTALTVDEPRHPPLDMRRKPSSFLFGQLVGVRRGFVETPGRSVMDRQADLSTIRGLLTYIPRAFAVALLAPFPWQWFDSQGSTGGLRLCAAADMVLIYCWLIPACLFGLGPVMRRRRLEELFLSVFVVSTALLLGLVVANVGTLFRLRLMFLIPLLLIAAQADWRPRYGARKMSA